MRDRYGRQLAEDVDFRQGQVTKVVFQKALDESRIEVLTLRNRRLVAKLQSDFSLGRGEAEAIALALDEKAQIVGIDDKNGIDACKVLGIAFATDVGILIRSRENGLLEKPDAIAKLVLQSLMLRSIRSQLTLWMLCKRSAEAASA
jgi:predicted nucleic acid-binding protein